MKQTGATRVSGRRPFAMAGVSAGAALLAQGRVFANEGENSPAAANATTSNKKTTFASIKQTDAGLLNVGYAEAGPANGPAVILLHGWPYDIYSFVDVAPLSATGGSRVIGPYLRGYGATRFLSSDTFRNGQQSVAALDIITLMDALKIQKAILAGFDWGARTADIMAALWPERCKGLVSVSGYLIGSQAAGKAPLPPKAGFAWWYQFILPPTEARRITVETGTIFRCLSGSWHRRSRTSMMPRSIAVRHRSTNPDHVAIVIRNYRWRQALGARRGDI